MAVHTSRKSAGFSKTQEQLTKVRRLPAPNKGIDARVALGEMGAQNCVYTYNLIPAEYGMLVRPGFREWEINITNGGNLGIKTIMVFESASSSTNDKLFVANNEGIWDVTSLGGVPVLKVAFSDTSADSGNGVFTHYTEDAGAEYLLYADINNGLFAYTQSTNTWAQETGIVGPTIANIVFVVVHKQRLWFIEKDTTKAWYMPVASRQGTAIEFFFGSKFPRGGQLAALINWSVDGGLGLDDFLVAVSTNGDVLPYQGTDPTSTTTWELKGTYNIGGIPVGRRFFSEYSGELYLLSSFGLISMGDLLRGVDVRDVSARSLTHPIATVLRAQLTKSGTRLGWEPRFIPSLGVLIIRSPVNESTGKNIQYVMNLAVEGWGIWRDVPMTCLEEWKDLMYFGTEAGSVQIMDVQRDNVLLDTTSALYQGDSIKYSLLTGYSDLGTPAQFKIGQFVRPDFLSSAPPSFQSKILYDYEVGETLFTVIDDTAPLTDLWDVGTWDSAVWGSSTPLNYNKLQGQGGIGRTIAVALRGETVEETRLVAFDLMWMEGGVL